MPVTLNTIKKEFKTGTRTTGLKTAKEVKKAALCAEDMAKGVYAITTNLPKQAPQICKQSACKVCSTG